MRSVAIATSVSVGLRATLARLRGVFYKLNKCSLQRWRVCKHVLFQAEPPFF